MPSFRYSESWVGHAFARSFSLRPLGTSGWARYNPASRQFESPEASFESSRRASVTDILVHLPPAVNDRNERITGPTAFEGIPNDVIPACSGVHGAVVSGPAIGGEFITGTNPRCPARDKHTATIPDHHHFVAVRNTLGCDPDANLAVSRTRRNSLVPNEGHNLPGFNGPISSKAKGLPRTRGLSFYIIKRRFVNHCSICLYPLDRKSTRL